jgi:hypothetical protein
MIPTDHVSAVAVLSVSSRIQGKRLCATAPPCAGSSRSVGPPMRTIASETIRLGGALWIFGLVCLVIALVIILPYAAQSILSLSPLKVKVERATEPFKERWENGGKVLIGIAAVLATVGGAFLAVSGSKQPTEHKAQSPQANIAPATARPTIKLSNPHGTIQNPLMVSCQQDIQVAGRVPTGYTFAVGNVIIGQNADIVFVPEAAATLVAPNTWNVPIVFGGAADHGSKFTVYLEVLPTQQLNYLVAEAQSIRQYTSKNKYSGATWWRAPGLPPVPAIAQDQETVQRTTDQTGCPPS